MTDKLYQFLLNIFFYIRPLRIKMLFQGTKAWENYWINKKGGEDWNSKSSISEAYWESINHPHRQLLVDTIGKFKPKSILEIGCASGANLYLLAKKYPNAEIWGVDINKEAVDYGQRKFRELGMKNVWLATGKADRLLFADKSFDVVFTDAMLIYIGRDKISQVIESMLLIAKKGLVLCEWHNENLSWLGEYKDGVWQRDYWRVFRRYVNKDSIKITKIPKNVWAEWDNRGAIIEVEL